MANDLHPLYPPLPTSAPAKPFLGLMPNRANQDPAGAVYEQDGYTIAIVEFDDQGVCYDRQQMLAMADALEQLRGRDPIIIVFTHGWRHDARSDDDNLKNFLLVLKQTAIDAPERPVFGIFAGWRGLSWCGPLIEYPTLWGRQEAAWRVALGSIREMFGRLRLFRNAERDAGRHPLLVMIGHSFGGLITYSAVAQSLIEAATTPAGELIPSFADLVLLVNPAFAATRYLPIYDQISGRHDFARDQPPIFVSVTAHNDWATGVMFPIATFIPTLSESARGWRQRQAMLMTMGHLHWLRTYELTAPGVTTKANRQRRFQPGVRGRAAVPATLSVSDVELVRFRGGAELQRLGGADPNNPYWVVGATPTVVDGHNGIWGEVFVEFVYDLVAAHVARQHRSAETAPQPA
jgi:hypothetical protein